MVEELKRTNPDTPGCENTEFIKFAKFKVSTGWFSNFKTMAKIKKIKLHGESCSEDVPAAYKFCKFLQKKIDDQECDSRQIRNCDETGLFWKIGMNNTSVPITFAKSHGFKVDK
jgi:hypothetical protein